MKRPKVKDLADAAPETKAGIRQAVRLGRVEISAPIRKQLADLGMTEDDVKAALLKVTGGLD